ncbi:MULTISPECIES: YceI family protein [Pseudophaeobacter]|uniref:YceI family protein n=1 Tax=Pseudophaeobacter TaxID=1541822 RepID=UPI00242E356B|nr:YceI family protein [Pseudophaeobacter profundi]
MPSRRQMLLGLLGHAGYAGLVTTPVRLWAGNSGYRLDLDATTVQFKFQLNGIWQSGTMPITSSAIELNPNQLAATRVSVVLDATAAKTGFIIATQAMTGPEVLDIARYPTIHFTSRKIHLGAKGRLSDGAEITGDLTLRGITKPITLQAALYRRAGSAMDDLSQLEFRLTGSLSRAAYGASGFAALVGDRVQLAIDARIIRDQ